MSDLAARFDLPSTEAAIERLRALEAEGVLPGVFDERGAFIHVTPDEMAALADAVNRAGRVWKGKDLVRMCNELIRLDPDAKDAAATAAEEEAALALVQQNQTEG
eukprot:GHVU01047059.1.p6 GENE.GHVU01047059.1~~GHVU01047059.1.p6  ORF type:complete len:105 (-),score=28.96 GHVU01047059.1:711-1025(-)